MIKYRMELKQDNIKKRKIKKSAFEADPLIFFIELLLEINFFSHPLSRFLSHLSRENQQRDTIVTHRNSNLCRYVLIRAKEN